MAKHGYYMRELAQAASTLHVRLERIHKACISPAGYTQRGVPSWDQDALITWREEAAAGTRWALSKKEEQILERIEKQVFGDLLPTRRS